MTITYPRDLLAAHRFNRAEFMELHQVTLAPSRGGRVQAAELGPALWRPVYQTARLTLAQASEWEAWLSTMQGGTRLFKAWSPVRQYARTYPGGYGGLLVGGNPWDGIGTITDVGAQLDSLTIEDLPVGFALKPGDMLSFPYASGRQALHRVVESATANGSGIATVGVRPLVKPEPDTDAVAMFTRPWCLASVLASSIRAPWNTEEARSIMTVSFEAIQTLDPS